MTCTVRKTLPISAPTSRFRPQAENPFSFCTVLFTQRIFAFVLSFSQSGNFLLSFTSSGKLKILCLILGSILYPSMLDSTPLPTLPFLFIFVNRFKQYTIKKVFERLEKYLLFVTFLEK